MLFSNFVFSVAQWRTQKFVFRVGGVQQIQLTGGRENRDLGAVAPSQGFRPICKWVKPVFLLGSYDVVSTELGIRLGFVKTSE
jgi:hypothetical protein